MESDESSGGKQEQEIVCETERLKIRKVVEADHEFIKRLMTCETWLQYIGDRNLKTEKDAKDLISFRMIGHYDKFGFGSYIVELKESNDHKDGNRNESVKWNPIGLCGVLKREYLDAPDLGFAFLPEYEGRGYGFESSKAVIQYARSKLHIQKLTGITQQNNTRSINLLKRLGFAFEQTLPASVCQTDTDQMVFVLLP